MLTKLIKLMCLLKPKYILTVMVILTATYDAKGYISLLDEGLKTAETVYNDLENKVSNAYETIKETAYGQVMGVVETADRYTSQAITKIKDISADCRLPAEFGLQHLKMKFKADFKQCANVKIQEKNKMLDLKRQNFIENLKSSYNTSVTAIKTCLQEKFESLTRFNLDLLGTCELPTGLSVSARIIDDSASVQKLVVEILASSYDYSVIVTNCFKSEIFESTADSLITSAEKCQNRIRKL